MKSCSVHSIDESKHFHEDPNPNQDDDLSAARGILLALGIGSLIYLICAAVYLAFRWGWL